MKLQFLGDSKDSFKWDYHDWLTSELKIPQLTVALMLTPDNAGTHGGTKAEEFPARTAVLRFCRELQARRDIELIKKLPSYTGGAYEVVLHNGPVRPLIRSEYFSGFDPGRNQLVFIDPDNGFEPERSCDEAHVAYADVGRVLSQLNENSIVSVFQIHRRKSFSDDLAQIRTRLGSCFSTALHWHSLMFVTLATSEQMIASVAAANQKYARSKPVKVIP